MYYKIRHLIIEYVIKKVQNDKMFDKYTNADIIDRAVVSSNCWLLYGCCKPNKEPYIVSKYYDNKNDSIDVEALGESKELSDSYHYVIQDGMIVHKQRLKKHLMIIQSVMHIQN